MQLSAFSTAAGFAIALFCAGAEATGGLNGLPVLNGPVPVVPSVKGSKKRVGDFVHPGLWHTHDDLERIRLGVGNKTEPYFSAFKKFSNSSFSQADYSPKGPQKTLCRGGCNNYAPFTADARAAYQNALMWYITGDKGNWHKAAQILDDWGGNLTDVIGTDTSLLVGLEGDLFVNAAEIMRWEGGWVERGARAIGTTGFSNQLYWLFAKQSINIGQANYGMYNYAVHAFYNDPCAGIYANFDTATGQGSETGRDQGHSKGALGWAAEAARVIQSQGTDVYGEGDHLILKGSEYTAQYNLGNDVPYDKKFYRCEAILVNGPWERPSNISRGIPSPAVFDIIYYQYVVKRGMSAPWTAKMKKAIDALGGEGGDGGDDHPGWGDLIWSYPGKGSFKNNNDRTIWGGGRLGSSGLGNVNQ